jgi:tetratricopeptide (TPR) repeat protein
MSECARPDCHQAGKSFCSGCGREQYCGSACQKQDWKKHKSMCPVLKKLSNTLQPYDEVVQVVKEMIESKKGDNIRIFEHLLLYTEYQFGKPIIGKDYRERTDGQRISNWNVDICYILKISSTILYIYATNPSLSTMIRDKEMCHHLEKSLHILSPWMDTIDSDATSQSNSITSIERNYLLKQSSILERRVAIVALNRNQFDVAERHSHRCLVNSRRFRIEGSEKTTLIFQALSLHVHLRQNQGNFSGAVTFAEEAYNLVVDAYDPVHPQVQEAAGWFINCLILLGDLSNAERFVEQTYANLRDIKNGMDQEGEQVAVGAHNWADVIFRQEDGDLIKAEGLAREAVRIKDQFCNAHDSEVSAHYSLLARILQKQGKFGDETKELYERSLAIYIRNEGPDGANTAGLNIDIGQFYYQIATTSSVGYTKRTQLLIAKSYIDEAIRIETKIHNPTHPNSVGATSLLSNILSELL